MSPPAARSRTISSSGFFIDMSFLKHVYKTNVLTLSSALYWQRFAPGPSAARPLVHPRGHRAWRADVRRAGVARHLHPDRPAAVPGAAVVIDVGLQDPVPDRQRLQH